MEEKRAITGVQKRKIHSRKPTRPHTHTLSNHVPVKQGKKFHPQQALQTTTGVPIMELLCHFSPDLGVFPEARSSLHPSRLIFVSIAEGMSEFGGPAARGVVGVDYNKFNCTLSAGWKICVFVLPFRLGVTERGFLFFSGAL